MPYITPKEISYQKYLCREHNTRHLRYDEELVIFNKIKAGDIQAVEDGLNLFTSELVGHLSSNSLIDKKYLFVAGMTLITRHAIEGGLEEEDVFITSDLYIQRVDQCNDIDSIVSLYKDMLTHFTLEFSKQRRKNLYSKPIFLCTDYIYHHLHEKISVKTLSSYVNLNSNYLISLFKKETGQTISKYILNLRLETAKNMLLYSNASSSDIASILAFSSQSYFIKVFRQFYGLTPNQYKHKYYRITHDNSE